MTPERDNSRETEPGGEARVRADVIEQLADQLSRSYDVLPLAELKAADPDRAQDHHDAAHDLRGWLRGFPRREEKAAWQRGWERAMARAGRRIADLEAVIASQQPDEQDLPGPASDWHLARQDPRYALVRREILGLDTVDGTMALSYPLQELLALRVLAALRASEQPGQPHPHPPADRLHTSQAGVD
ncbi:hypothetical protein ACWCQP_44845 [Streptomyces chartreusis]